MPELDQTQQNESAQDAWMAAHEKEIREAVPWDFDALADAREATAEDEREAAEREAEEAEQPEAEPEKEEPAAAVEKAEPETDGDAPEEDATDEDFAKAKRTLEAAGVPKSILEGLDRDEATRWAERERQRMRDFQELREQIRGHSENQKPDQATDKAAQPAEPSAAPDLEKARKAIEETFDTEDAQRFADYTTALVAPYEQRIKAQEERIVALEGYFSAQREQAARSEVEAARQELRERFPQLMDDAAFGSPDKPEVGTFLHRMLRLGKAAEPGEYPTLRALVEATAQTMYPDAKVVESQRKSGEAASKRRGAQPVRPRTKPPEKAVSGDERQAEYLRLRQQEGLSRDEALRRVGAA